MSEPQTAARRLTFEAIDGLVPALKNPKRHDLDALGASVGRFGFLEPVVVDDRTGRLVAGHGRVEELQRMHARGAPPPSGIDVDEKTGAWSVPVVRGWASRTDAEADAYLVASNRTTELGGWDAGALSELLSGLAETDDLLGSGYDDSSLADLLESLTPDDPEAGDPRRPTDAPTLADRFLVPPFSVLDARQGYWQERKRAWLALGIRSELGRGDLLTYTGGRDTDAETDDVTRRIRSTVRSPGVSPGGSPRPSAKLGPDGKTERGDGAGRKLRETPGGGKGPSSVGLTKPAEGGGYSPGAVSVGATRREADKRSNLTGAQPLPEWADNGTEYMTSGTSIFDPVLCELAYRWFSPPGGRVLDPFAGGSVRGIVAGMLGRHYTGVDLAGPQVGANEAQGEALCRGPVKPEWHQGDSRAITAEWPPAPEPFDLIFSCPPYFDLEVYTDDPDDLSQAPDRDAFVAAMAEVLTACAARLADDRFVVLVMGEARAKNGDLYGLVPGTIAAAAEAGLDFYNEAILVTMVGSLPLRVGRQFPASRKLGRTHQSVLVFVKGDGRAAADACGVVEVGDPAEFIGDVEGG